MLTISVVIPNFNYGCYIAKAIDSVLGQTLSAHEIIVVDDGSTDDSIDILRSYGERIKLMVQKNRGVGAARNAGAERASGDLLAFLDADDYWCPQKLEKQAAKMESDFEIGLVHCGLLYVDERGNPLEEYLIGEEGWVAEKLLTCKPVIVGPGSTSLIRRDVYFRVGGYDSNKELHPSEDWDLSYRIAREWKFGFVREPLLHYRQHGRGGHTNISRMERAMLLGFEKAFQVETDVSASAAYGNLYRVLSGTYFNAGDYGGFLRNAVKSIWMRPGNLGYFLKFPIRRWGKKRVVTAQSSDKNG